MTNLGVGKVIQSFSAAVAKLSPEEIELILADKASITIVVKPLQANLKVQNPKSIGLSDLRVDELAVKLEQASSREEGFSLLQTLTKVELQGLAKNFSLSIDSAANKEKLVEKIVERKVGLRLRQDAFTHVMNQV